MTNYPYCFNHSIVNAKTERTAEAHSYFAESLASIRRKFNEHLAGLSVYGLRGTSVRVEEYHDDTAEVVVTFTVKGSSNVHTMTLELNDPGAIDVALRMMTAISKKYVR